MWPHPEVFVIAGDGKAGFRLRPPQQASLQASPL